MTELPKFLTPGFKIKELFAFTAIDPTNDTEGIMSAQLPNTPIHMPLIGADMDRVESLKPLARKAAALASEQAGRKFKVKLYKFTTKEFVEDIN